VTSSSQPNAVRSLRWASSPGARSYSDSRHHPTMAVVAWILSSPIWGTSNVVDAITCESDYSVSFCSGSLIAVYSNRCSNVLRLGMVTIPVQRLGHSSETSPRLREIC
jgi:hypothetical protein